MPPWCCPSRRLRRRVGFAGAVQAAVRRTKLAGLKQPLLELLPRAMEPNFQISGRNTEARRDLPGRFSIKINPAHQFRIFGLQSWQQPGHAPANDAVRFRVGRIRQFDGEPFQCLRLGRFLPIKINDGIPQDAIEPRHEFFVVAQFLPGAEGLEHRVLHHVRCQLWIVQPASGESAERREIVRQNPAKRFFRCL